jgi:putative SOS response-associated peptidase YedK
MCYSIMIETNLKKLEAISGATTDQAAFDRYDALHKKEPKIFRQISDHDRVYPNYFAPVITSTKDLARILPMRYRIRPAGSPAEIPSKYNLFNARIDMLQSRQTWRSLFMKRHGLVFINGFYEWVEDDQTKKKNVVYFTPQDQVLSYLAVPVIYDIWVAADRSRGFASFALLTGKPPQTVLAAGHDRCPIILDQKHWKSWLSPNDENELMQILEDSQANTPMAVSPSHP